MAHFGGWRSEMAWRRVEDGTLSLVTLFPNAARLQFVTGEAAGRHTPTLRDAQHEYVFTAVD